MKRSLVLCLAALVLYGATTAKSETSEEAEKKLTSALAAAVSKAIRSTGATLESGNVVVDPNPGNTSLGSPDVRVHIDVPAQDCRAVEAIARAIEASTNVLASPHGVDGIKFFAIMADTKVKGEDHLVDRRDIALVDMLKLRSQKARTSQYLGLGELDAAVFTPARNSSMVSTCTQRLCAPEPATACTPGQNGYVPGKGIR